MEDCTQLKQFSFQSKYCCLFLGDLNAIRGDIYFSANSNYIYLDYSGSKTISMKLRICRAFELCLIRTCNISLPTFVALDKNVLYRHEW